MECRSLRSPRPLHSWYATFCELAGVALADPAAAKAGLPGLDSLSMVGYLTGRDKASPRTELQIDSNVLLMEQTAITEPATPTPRADREVALEVEVILTPPCTFHQ
jgi:hypothetical protein